MARKNCDEKTTEIQTTFRAMGIHVEKRIAPHLLLENAYENNLVSDISQVDYTEGSLGPTNLQPLDGLPMFVDDIYVYGYLSREEVVYSGNRVSLSTGEKGQARKVVAAIQTCIGATFGVEEKPIHVSIMQTVRCGRYGIICKTIERIERDTGNKTIDQWKHLRGEDPDACVVAKIDVSEISIDKLHQHMEQFQKYLFACGYGLYCIDYTQDFSGTLDRNKLVQHLVDSCGMREQGDLCNAMDQDAPTILANTESVGNNVCTWVQTNSYGKTVRAKIYNKIVSNFEAGEVREPFGGHLADYADCSNEHLRKTFVHPDVQARGCTRVEVSLYACRIGEDLSQGFGQETISEVLQQVEGNRFVVQPAKKQWENLAKAIDRCCVVADRTTGAIYMAWFANTKTGRLAGIQVHPKHTEEQKWEKAVQWTMSEFGFRICPIFRIDVLHIEEEEKIVSIDPLRCYTKADDTKTVLARASRPTEIHKGESPCVLLPPTKHIEWEWRTTKTKNAIGIEKQRYAIEEIPTNRKISTLSTRNRAAKLEQILEQGKTEEWRREKELHMQQNKEERLREIERIAEKVVAKEKEVYIRETVLSTTFGHMGKIADIPEDVSRISVWGFENIETKLGISKKIVAQFGDCLGLFWSTNQISGAIDVCLKNNLFREYSKNGRKTVYYVPSAESVLVFDLAPKTRLFSNDGKEIYTRKQTMVNTDKFLANIQEAIQNIESDTEDTLPAMQEIKAPKTTNMVRTQNMEQGEYTCYKYAKTTYRGKPRTILFLEKDGMEIATYGPFLEEEASKIDFATCIPPLHCRIGGFRNTISRNKDRTISLASMQSAIKLQRQPLPTELSKKVDVQNTKPPEKKTEPPKKVHTAHPCTPLFPETSIKKLLPGNYAFEEYYTKPIGKKGKMRMQLHLYGLDDKGKRIGFKHMYSAYGPAIEKEIAKIDLENTLAPVYCAVRVLPSGVREFEILDRSSL